METENSGYAVYKLFTALKLHFTSESYDFFKYNGKTTLTKEGFMLRRDRYHFYRLSRKYSMQDMGNYFVSMFMYGDKCWASEMNDNESEKIYRNWCKVNQSMVYEFSKDVSYLFDNHSTVDLFTVRGGAYPKILTEVMEENINIETFIILNDILDFFPRFNDRIQDDVIWPQFRLKCEKYAPFLDYDKSKFKEILKEHYAKTKD